MDNVLNEDISTSTFQIIYMDIHDVTKLIDTLSFIIATIYHHSPVLNIMFKTHSMGHPNVDDIYFNQIIKIK